MMNDVMNTTRALVRAPAVAGTFYASDPKALLRDIQGFLNAVPNVEDSPPKAIIAPHAGYVYSGPVAAYAYAPLAPLKGTITRVVLLGPCHRVSVAGMALTNADSYATPLGNVAIDHSFDDTLLKLSGVEVFDAPHVPEHSLEVHVPFLQTVLGDFQLIPIVVGGASPDEVADVLKATWGGPETLIVISSDLSHFLDYDTARTLDQKTSTAIENLDGAAIGDDQACGRHPVKGLLEVAKQRNLRVKTLDLRNSGDTAGPKDRVVGYGSWAFWETV